jgi:hypothetical protein
MFKVAKLGIAIAAVLALIVPAAYAGVPDINNSFYVPQTGPVGPSATEGNAAIILFHACPNNDGGTSLPNNCRIKVVVNDVNGNPVAGVAAADICILFNGGTGSQGFSGVGADSVIANSTWNQSPICPDVRCLSADAPTDASGTTYITFAGASSSNPGVTLRDPNRKWGHYDAELPVYVLGFKISGRLTTASMNGTYILRIKNYDVAGGTGPQLNQGEAVTGIDFNAMVANFGKQNPITYWLDYNNSNSVTGIDFNALVGHLGHNCAVGL